MFIQLPSQHVINKFHLKQICQENKNLDAISSMTHELLHEKKQVALSLF